MPDYIDMTPTPDGYAAIAATFARSVIDDVKVSRQTDASAMLVQAIEIAFYLGNVTGNDPDMTPEQARDLRDRMTVRISTYLPRPYTCSRCGEKVAGWDDLSHACPDNR